MRYEDGTGFANTGQEDDDGDGTGTACDDTPYPPAIAACRAEADASGENPDSYNIIASTDGNDDFDFFLTSGPDWICGFGGNDRVRELSPGDTFRGGDGNDRVDTMTGGLFDTAFFGGEGADSSQTISGGSFFGGPGDDTVFANFGFVQGEAGNDTVNVMFDGTFNGGVGDDRTCTYVAGTLIGVEATTCEPASGQDATHRPGRARSDEGRPRHGLGRPS